MAVVHKFDFDLSFDREPRRFEYADDLKPEPVAPPTFSVEELEAARRQAVAEGRAAGEAQVREQAERQTTDALDLMTRAIEQLAEADDIAVEVAERRAATVLLEALRKLFPALVERSGLMEIESLLQDVFSHSIEQSRLIIRCSVALQARIEPLVRGAAARAAFDGKLAVLADQSLSNDDFRIDWPDGGVERSSSRMLEKIERAIADGMEAYDRRAADQAAKP